MQQLVAVAGLGERDDIVPVSAVTRFGLDVLEDVLISKLPTGRPLYPAGELTDEPEQVMVAELIREAALEGVRDELPHSIAVVVEEMGPRPGRPDLTDVHALMYLERPSQKAIVLGPQGVRLKEVGTKARHRIEALLGTRVYLDLHIKIAKDWQRDPKQLRRLGSTTESAVPPWPVPPRPAGRPRGRRRAARSRTGPAAGSRARR